MKANQEDRVSSDPQGKPFPLIPALLGLAVVAALLWFFLRGSTDQPAMPEPDTSAKLSQAQPLPAPDIPEPKAPEPTQPTAEAAPPVPAPPPLPPLEASDEALREQLAIVATQPRLEKLLRSDNLIQRGTGVITALSRGQVEKKLIPFDPPAGKFSVIKEGDAMYVDPASYRRYDAPVAALLSVDSKVLGSTFHRFRPLFEQAYGELGHEPEAFDNAVIATLDLILATAEPAGRLALQRKSVMYTYADPSLEKLAPLQKQLLRTGPDNMRRIKQYAQELRTALLTPQ